MYDLKPAGETFAVVGATSAPIIGAHSQRIGLRLSPPGAGRVTLSTQNPAVIDQGLTLTAGMQPIYICGDCMGRLIQSQWHAIADAAARTIGIFEVYDL